MRPETDLYYVAEETETPRRRRQIKMSEGTRLCTSAWMVTRRKPSFEYVSPAMPRGCGAATPGVSGCRSQQKPDKLPQDTMGHYRLTAHHLSYTRPLLTH